MTPEVFSPAELAAIKTYHRPFYWDGALHDPVALVLILLTCRFAVRPLFAAAERLAGWIHTRLGEPRVRTLERLWGGPGYGAAVLFAVGLGLLFVLLGFPEKLYFDYVLEHRAGISVVTPLRFAWNELKVTGLGLVLLGLLAFGLFGLMRRVPRWWLLLGLSAGGLLVLSAALDPYTNRIVFEQTPLPAGPVRSRIEAMLGKAGIPFENIVVEKRAGQTRAMNGYFAGEGPTRSIVLTDTLLQNLTPDEVLAVVAHEAGHLASPSRWPGRIAAALALFAMLYGLNLLFKFVARRGWMGVTHPADIRLLPVITLAFFILEVVAFPLSNAHQRARELAADRFGEKLTGDPKSFESMLVKLARVNRLDPEPPRWVVLLEESHPPILERIRKTGQQQGARSSPTPAPHPL